MISTSINIQQLLMLIKLKKQKFKSQISIEVKKIHGLY